MKKAIYLLLFLLAFVKVSGQGSCLPTTTCPDAPLFCGYELEHNMFNNNVQPGGGIEPACGILPHNTIWFRILPCSPNLLLVVNTVTSQTNDGLQVALFQGCAQGMDIACNDGMQNGAGIPLPLNANVTPGQEYWLMVDGYEGDICDFQIDVISGLDTNQPVPDPNAPFDGNIVGPSGFTCTGGTATYTVTWPGCDNWTGSGFSCAADESCICIHWELPIGAFIIGDTCAATVTINFAGTPPGNYLLKATPECKCAEGACPDCGPVCCPVNPAVLPISITAPQVILLPEIVLCNGEPFPSCVFAPGGGVNGTTAWCQVSVDPTGCSIVQQPYRQDINCVFNCNALNVPAPPGDSCTTSPFFCGDFLENYCGSNAGLSDDVIGGVNLQNAGFIRFQPCSDSMVLHIGVGNCNINDSGLKFGLYEGACATNSISTQTIPEFSFSDLTFTNLQVDVDYTLVVSGVNNSECAFNISVVEGIGTATPGTVECSCTDGQVEGPDKLCPGDIATYTINFPDCSLTVGPPTGGNGYTCMPSGVCPDNGQDSFKLVWHIPQGTSFIGDSTGTTIDILVGDDLAGLDSIRHDSVWVSWELVTPPPPSGDSLTFCTCSGGRCAGTIKPKYITIEHHLIFETCVLNCYEFPCHLNGIIFTQPGQYTVDVDNCTTLNAFILADFNPPPPPLVSPVTICQGDQATLKVSNISPLATYNWSNGQSGPTITVSPSSTTTYKVTATNQNNGCTMVSQVIVTVTPLVIIDLGVVGAITCQEPCFIFQGQPYCQPGTFEIPTGNCQRTRFTILFDPTIPTVTLPAQSICEGTCIDFFGQQLCATGIYTHTENCTQFVQQVTVLPIQDVQLGIVGSVTCAAPCIDFQGVTYCAPGVYTVQTGQCSSQTFEINFEKDTLELGEVGIITCAQPCVDFEGQSYCTEGNYTTEDSCLVKHFSIGFDPFIPTVNQPPVTICEGQCFDFFGQQVCSSGIVSQENNCTLFVQEVIVLPLEDVQLGVVASVTCTQPCVDFQGNSYCSPGVYTVQTGQCSSLTFEIIFEKDSLELGEVGVVTCAQPCVDFEGQSYCAAGIYTTEDSCLVKHFSIGFDPFIPTVNLPPVTICEGQCFDFFGQQICTTSVVSQENNCTLFVQEVIVLPLEDVQLGVVASVTCAQPCVDFQGSTYCSPGVYIIQTGQCSSLTFEIIFEKDTLELGEVGVVTCAQPCIDFEGQSYCAAGNYTTEDSCLMKHFSIGANMSQPLASAPTHNCLPSNAQYTVAFSITGLPPFKVNSVAIGGSNYLSSPIQNGTAYAFVVEQSNGCQTVVSGNFNCASMCNTNAGLLSNETLHGCAGQSTLQVQSAAAPTLAANDVVEYWLQTAAGALISRNNTGEFAFNPALMTAGQTYFARRLVGSADQDGHPDLQNICTDSSTAQPLIFHALPNVAIAGETAVCRGNTLTLQASGAKTYQWQDGSSAAELVFNASSALQTQMLTVVGTDAVGCIDTATFALSILENPVLDEAVVTPPHCSNMNDGAIEIKQAHGAVEPLTYRLNGLPLANGSGFENLSPGAYTLNMEDAFGCESDSVFNLPEPVLPSLNIGPDRQINIGTSVTLNADASTPPVNITWSADNGMGQAGGLDWTLKPLQHVLVHCEIVDANGCIATDEAQILVKTEDGIYRPNVLMIGANQGENQHFTIFSVEGWISEITSLQIYDRWGEMVWENRNFQANIPNLGWDGTNKGEMAMPGVYVYLAVVQLANGEQRTLKGDVTLVR